MEAQESLRGLRLIVADCFRVNPWIYWADLLGTAVISWGSFALTELFWGRSFPVALASLVVCVFASYRGILFIHELTHQGRADLPGFSLVWNLLFGTPYVLPSFLYRGVHLQHHTRAFYGTANDGEYLPFGASPLWKSVWYVSQSLLMPASQFLRFGLIAPLSFIHPRLRRYVMAHASAVTLRRELPRRIPTGKDLRNWHVQECLCFIWVACLGSLLWTGTVSPGFFFHLYGLMVVMFVVNSLRTLLAHRFANGSGQELTITEQLLDSINLEGMPVLIELPCPLGLRYHALHHLFPAIPYHNLGVAHRRLRAQLPRASFYHSTVEPSVTGAVAALLRNTSRAIKAIPADPESLPTQSRDGARS